MPARLGRAPSPFRLCVTVAFPAQRSSLGGWRESGEGQAGVLAARAGSSSDGFASESGIRVAVV